MRTKPLPPPPNTNPPLLPRHVYQRSLTNTATSYSNINGTVLSHDTRIESHGINYRKTKPLPPLPGTPPPVLSRPIWQRTLRNTAQSTSDNASTVNGTRLLSRDTKAESRDLNSRLPVMRPIKPHSANTRSKFKQLPDRFSTPEVLSSGKNEIKGVACYHGHVYI